MRIVFYKIKSYIDNGILIRSLVRKEVFGVDWGEKKERKEIPSEGKRPLLIYPSTPLLLTNPNPSDTFFDLPLICHLLLSTKY